MTDAFELRGTLKIAGRRVDLSALQVLGQGNERICLFDPACPEQVIKLSRRRRSMQTRREIAYFNLLKRRQVPFTHIPEYYGPVYSPDYIGIRQQCLLSSAACRMITLDREVRGSGSDSDRGSAGRVGLTAEELQAAFADLKAYLLRWSVLPSDLQPHNVMVRRHMADGSISLCIIDGFGSHNLIKLNNYLPALGRRTILKQCRKLAHFTAVVSGGRFQLQP